MIKKLAPYQAGRKGIKNYLSRGKTFQSTSINTAHLLLCVLRNENDPTTKLLNKLKVDYDNVKDQFKLMMTNDDDYIEPIKAESFSEDDGDSSKENPFNAPGNKTNKKSKTPVLDNFGRDLTAMAEEDKLDPVVGRAKEIERVSQILSRRKRITRCL